MPLLVVTKFPVAQVELILDSTLHKLNLLQPCFLDEMDCFNMRKHIARTSAVYGTGAVGRSDAKFHITTSPLNNKPKIENTISDYVKKHMFDMLQENNYNLFLSGGIDSENIANILIDCGITFTPIIVSYVHKGQVLNDYDISYAYQFCKNNNITPTVIDIDIIDFFNSGKFRKYAFDYQCESPQFAPILHAFEKIDGNIIYSGHQKIFTNLVYNSRKNNTSLAETIDNFSLNGKMKNDVNFMEKFHSFFVFDSILKDRNDSSISDFYNYNTDISLTATNNFINNTAVTYNELLEYNGWRIQDNTLLWQQEWQDSEAGIINTREFKNRCIKKQRYNFKVQHLYTPNKLFARARPKYTGFEGIKKFYSDKYIGKDLLLQEFDKYFRETMQSVVNESQKDSSMIVNYILRKK